VLLLLRSADAKDDAAAADEDEGEDDGFCVIPIPDCFNLDLPATKNAITSLVVKKTAASSAASGVLQLIGSSLTCCL